MHGTVILLTFLMKLKIDLNGELKTKQFSSKLIGLI